MKHNQLYRHRRRNRRRELGWGWRGCLTPPLYSFAKNRHSKLQNKMSTEIFFSFVGLLPPPPPPPPLISFFFFFSKILKIKIKKKNKKNTFFCGGGGGGGGAPGAPVWGPPMYTSWNTELVDWLIDWIDFYAVSVIFEPCNGGDYKSQLVDVTEIISLFYNVHSLYYWYPLTSKTCGI